MAQSTTQLKESLQRTDIRINCLSGEINQKISEVHKLLEQKEEIKKELKMRDLS